MLLFVHLFQKSELGLCAKQQLTKWIQEDDQNDQKNEAKNTKSPRKGNNSKDKLSPGFLRRYTGKYALIVSKKIAHSAYSMLLKEFR